MKTIWLNQRRENHMAFIQAVTVASCASAELYWRHVLPTFRFPKVLCWLCFHAARVMCRSRSRIATLMINATCTADLDGDATSWKIALLFKSQLRATSLYGTISEELYTLISNMCVVWYNETQKIEGDNNKVQKEIELAPNMRLPLASARNTIGMAVTVLRDRLEITTAPHLFFEKTDRRFTVDL